MDRHRPAALELAGAAGAEPVSAWAETSVKARGGPGQDYPPLEGEACPRCDREFRQGERVYRLTREDEIRIHPPIAALAPGWVCEPCLHHLVAR